MIGVVDWWHALWHALVLPDTLRFQPRKGAAGGPLRGHDLHHDALRRQLEQIEAQPRVVPSHVLIVEDDHSSRTLLEEVVRHAGLAPVTHTPDGTLIDGPEAGLRALRGDPSIALILTDVWMPTAAEGVAFIRQVRREWPLLPLVAITAHPDSLVPLRGTPESPPVLFEKPINVHQVQAFLRMLPLVRAAPQGGSTDPA